MYMIIFARKVFCKVVVRTGAGLLNWRPFTSNTHAHFYSGEGNPLAPGIPGGEVPIYTWVGWRGRQAVGRPIAFPPSWPNGLTHLRWVSPVFSVETPSGSSHD